LGLVRIHLHYTVPLAIALGALGLAAFLWSLENGQYDDLDGAARRAIGRRAGRPMRSASGQHQPEDHRDPAQVSNKGQLGRRRGVPNSVSGEYNGNSFHCHSPSDTSTKMMPLWVTASSIRVRMVCCDLAPKPSGQRFATELL